MDENQEIFIRLSDEQKKIVRMLVTLRFAEDPELKELLTKMLQERFDNCLQHCSVGKANNIEKLAEMLGVKLDYGVEA